MDIKVYSKKLDCVLAFSDDSQPQCQKTLQAPNEGSYWSNSTSWSRGSYWSNSTSWSRGSYWSNSTSWSRGW